MLIYFYLLEKILSPRTNARFRSEGERRTEGVSSTWGQGVLTASEAVTAKKDVQWQGSGHQQLSIYGKEPSNLTACSPGGYGQGYGRVVVRARATVTVMVMVMVRVMSSRFCCSELLWPQREWPWAGKGSGSAPLVPSGPSQGRQSHFCQPDHQCGSGGSSSLGDSTAARAVTI